MEGLRMLKGDGKKGGQEAGKAREGERKGEKA